MINRFSRVTLFHFLLVLFSFISSACTAQKFLALDRAGHTRRIRFYVNDEISLKLRDQMFFLSGPINEINDTDMIVDGHRVSFSQIELLRFDRKSRSANLLQQVSVKFPAAGVFLLGLALINSALNPVGIIFTRQTLIEAGALIASGPVAHRLSCHKIKINKRNTLRVIDVSIK